MSYLIKYELFFQTKTYVLNYLFSKYLSYIRLFMAFHDVSKKIVLHKKIQKLATQTPLVSDWIKANINEKKKISLSYKSKKLPPHLIFLNDYLEMCKVVVLLFLALIKKGI